MFIDESMPHHGEEIMKNDKNWRISLPQE